MEKLLSEVASLDTGPEVRGVVTSGGAFANVLPLQASMTLDDTAREFFPEQSNHIEDKATGIASDVDQGFGLKSAAGPNEERGR